MKEPQTTRNKLIEKCAQMVPANWCDSLLTGPNGIGEPPYDCRHIEKLLRGCRDNIRGLKEKP